MFGKNNTIKTKHDINLYSRCIDCGFKKSETIDKKNK